MHLLFYYYNTSYNITNASYNEYQYFIYGTISRFREKEMTFNHNADHLNKKKILSARGRKFRGGHVHSIMQKKKSKR